MAKNYLLRYSVLFQHFLIVNKYKIYLYLPTILHFYISNILMHVYTHAHMYIYEGIYKLDIPDLVIPVQTLA